MFRRPVIDRSLAFLRDPILISASKPVDRFIPFVDSELTLDKTLLGVIFHDFVHGFAIDDGAEFHREVHRVSVVDGNAPTHHFTGAARLVLAGMALFDVAGLVHHRHDKKINVSVASAIGNTPRISIQNAILKSLRIDLAVIPRRSGTRSMQPTQMVLIHGIFNHLKKVTVHRSGASSPYSVLSHEHVPTWQKRGRFRAEVGKNDPAQLLNFVRGMTNALPEGA